MAEEQGTQNGRVEFTQEELRDKSAAFNQKYGSNVLDYVRERPIDAELVRSTNDVLERAGNRAVADRAAEQEWREEPRPAFEAAARAGAWAPDWVGAGVPGNANERSVQDLKPAAQMSSQEIVAEVRGAHDQFQKLSEEFATASPDRRAELRQEMQPLVNRERELRQEFTGRLSPELTQDRVPEQQIAFGR